MEAPLVLCLVGQRLAPSDHLHSLRGCTVVPRFGYDLSDQGFSACNSACIGIVGRPHGEAGLVLKDWSLSDLFVFRSSFLHWLKLRLQVKSLVSLVLELDTDSVNL